MKIGHASGSRDPNKEPELGAEFEMANWKSAMSILATNQAMEGWQEKQRDRKAQSE